MKLGEAVYKSQSKNTDKKNTQQNQSSGNKKDEKNFKKEDLWDSIISHDDHLRLITYCLKEVNCNIVLAVSFDFYICDVFFY